MTARSFVPEFRRVQTQWKNRWAWGHACEPLAFALECATDPVLARLVVVASVIVYLLSCADEFFVTRVVV